jgi:hypothetical protein
MYVLLRGLRFLSRWGRTQLLDVHIKRLGDSHERFGPGTPVFLQALDGTKAQARNLGKLILRPPAAFAFFLYETRPFDVSGHVFFLLAHVVLEEK